MSVAAVDSFKPDDTGRSRRAVGWWLLVVSLLIALMVVIGGLTRLTGSGLSITEWKPVTGALPPLSEHAWSDEFARYRAIPQYRLVNSGMTLAQFKAIYWWEWSHRLLGRLIGFVFLVPFVWFAFRGVIARAAWPRFLGLFVLGGAQGAVGWWMVMSGLETRVSVSQYRLAIHLGVAIVLLGAMLWTAFDYLSALPSPPTGERAKAREHVRGYASRHSSQVLSFIGLVYLQMLLGALVAGLHAGLIYNTWPSMDGRVFPENPFFAQPWWINFFEDAGLVQFDHRIGAYVVFFSSVWLFLSARRAEPYLQRSAMLVLAITIVQLSLGILTLLNQAPVLLSACHQVMATALFAAAIWHAHRATGSMPVPAPGRR